MNDQINKIIKATEYLFIFEHFNKLIINSILFIM